MECTQLVRGLIVMVIVVVGGAFAVEEFLRRLLGRIDRQQPQLFLPPPRVRWWQFANEAVPGYLTGVLERSFFFLIIALQVEGAPQAMVTWLAVKMAANWNRFGDIRAFAAVLAGLVSMLIALIGGLIANGKLWFS